MFLIWFKCLIVNRKEYKLICNFYGLYGSKIFFCDSLAFLLCLLWFKYSKLNLCFGDIGGSFEVGQQRTIFLPDIDVAVY